MGALEQRELVAYGLIVGVVLLVVVGRLIGRRRRYRDRQRRKGVKTWGH
jgi:hypothetical protein